MKKDIRPTLCRDNNGLYIRMATDDYTIALENMRLQFVGARTESSATARKPAASPTANQTSVIITLKITNTSRIPRVLEPTGANHFALAPITSGKVFTESSKAEIGSQQQSLTAHDRTPVQPAKARTGDVIFDLPASDLATARRDGAVLVFTDFGGDLNNTGTNGPQTPAGELIIQHTRLR